MPLGMCEERGGLCPVQAARHALFGRHDVDADLGEILRGRHVCELLQSQQAFGRKRKGDAEPFNDAKDRQRGSQWQRDEPATALEVCGNELKEVRDGKSEGLSHDQRAGETLSQRQIDGLAQIVDVDGLKDTATAAKNRHDPGSPDEPSHLSEPGMLACAQNQTGSDDEVSRRIEEELERTFAPAIVGFRAGMGGCAGDKDEP